MSIRPVGLVWSVWSFTLTLKLSTDYLKVSYEFETGDLDIQGKICAESSNVCVIHCENDNNIEFYLQN